MQTLAAQVLETIQARDLIRPDARVLVAASGGLDSTVLLHLLHALSGPRRWRLVVAHFNHRLRGASSTADQRFVEDLSRGLGLACVVGADDARRLMRERGQSLEAAARRARHAFLARAACQQRAACVALAHHADDQVELFLLRLLRGASGEGLAGMRWRGPSPADARVTLVRPLLDQTREALDGYAQAQRLRHRTDASNAGLDPLRNRVRHRLVRFLTRGFQPALRRVVLRQADLLGADADFVRQAAEQWLSQPGGSAFDRLHVAVQRRVLASQLVALGVAPEFELIDHLRRRPEAQRMVGPRRLVWRNAEGRLETGAPGMLSFESGELPASAEANTVEFGGVQIRWDTAPSPRGARFRLPRPRAGIERFDADAVGARIRLRHWRAGDRFQPIGMPRPVKLQDLFTNQRVPASARRRAVVAEAADGRIFWVEGLRISECFKLDKTSRRRLNWHWDRVESSDVNRPRTQGCGPVCRILR